MMQFYNQVPFTIVSGTRQHGAVLIIILWIASALVTLVLVFGQSSVYSNRIAEYTKAGLQSEQTINSAVRYIQYVLQNQESPGQYLDSRIVKSEFVDIGDSYYWIIGRTEEPNQDINPTFQLIDESSKLNLNTASLEMLESLPNMTAEFAAAIIDWRDEDSEMTENGAEGSAYALLNPSYNIKNNFFESIFELKWVYNADTRLLFGEDWNHNGILDINENDGLLSLPEDNQNGVLDFGYIEYLTVFSREPNAGDSGRINVNEAEDDELRDLFLQYFDEERTDEILQDIQSQDDYISLLSVYQASGMTQDEFDQIEHLITISDDEFLYGLINVNTASQVILQCIPGIDEGTAREIVSTRQSFSERPTGIAWVSEILDEESIETAGPYLTSQAYQFTADICATSKHGDGYRRVLHIIDNSEDQPKVVYRKDLQALGWALGKSVRAYFEQAKVLNR